MMERLNINVSAIDYTKTSEEIQSILNGMQDMIHTEDEFIITDSEFAFGWHFFVTSISMDAIRRFADLMGSDFQKLKGKGTEKKFLTWLTGRLEKRVPKFKLAIKEEMESSKYGIF